MLLSLSTLEIPNQRYVGVVLSCDCHMTIDPQCNRTCDYCKNPAAAKELASRAARLSQSGGKGQLGSCVGSMDSAYSLYGGGRYGYKRLSAAK